MVPYSKYSYSLGRSLLQYQLAPRTFVGMPGLCSYSRTVLLAGLIHAIVSLHPTYLKTIFKTIQDYIYYVFVSGLAGPLETLVRPNLSCL